MQHLPSTSIAESSTAPSKRNKAFLKSALYTKTRQLHTSKAATLTTDAPVPKKASATSTSTSTFVLDAVSNPQLRAKEKALAKKAKKQAWKRRSEKERADPVALADKRLGLHRAFVTGLV